jgi:hypothetical protein
MGRLMFAVFLLAAPAWAQAPGVPGGPDATAKVPEAAPAMAPASAPAAGMQSHKRVSRHRRSRNDNIANQLNAQELRSAGMQPIAQPIAHPYAPPNYPPPPAWGFRPLFPPPWGYPPPPPPPYWHP